MLLHRICVDTCTVAYLTNQGSDDFEKIIPVRQSSRQLISEINPPNWSTEKFPVQAPSYQNGCYIRAKQIAPIPANLQRYLHIIRNGSRITRIIFRNAAFYLTNKSAPHRQLLFEVNRISLVRSIALLPRD